MSNGITKIMRDIGAEAKDTAQVLANASTQAKDRAIKIAALSLIHI